MEAYVGRQFVGIDLHRRRSVIVRMTEAGEQLSLVRIDNDPVALALEVAKAGPDPEAVLEATYGWYWAADVLAAEGARVHLAHPLGVKGFTYRRVKNDARDAADLADLLRMGRLPEAWVAPPQVRQLREMVRHRAKLVALRAGLKAQVHAVLAKQGVRGPEDPRRRRLADRRPRTPGRPPRPQHRHRRDRPQAAHPGLLRPARRARARPARPPPPGQRAGKPSVSRERRDRVRGRSAGLTPTTCTKSRWRGRASD
jgi:transposase